MPSIREDYSNPFLDRSFSYAAPCEWNKLSELIGTIKFREYLVSLFLCIGDWTLDIIYYYYKYNIRHEVLSMEIIRPEFILPFSFT